jgi:Golgi phosphoprotein 3
MLTLVEEVLLLTLHDKNGTFVSVPAFSLEYALSGAILMDLALRDRIDTDPEKLMIVDRTPTGDDLLDPVLEKIAGAPNILSTQEWLNALALDTHPIKEHALDRLVHRGILQRQEKKFLWVFGQRRYPVINNKEQREAKLRILGILLSDEIPEGRDTVLIALADACALFESILSREEYLSVTERIQQVARMDLIGQAMIQMIHEMRRAVSSVPPQV